MIHITEEIKVTRIYLITNIDNNPFKVYIGKTGSKKGRKQDHIFTYGKQITYDYIDQVNSLDKEDYIPLEKYWIEQFRQWGFIIINKNKGGGGPSFLSEETKLKISKATKGKKVSKSTRKKMSKSHTGTKKPIVALIRLGKKRSQESINKSREKLKGRKQSKKHIKNRSESKWKPVLQYDLEMNFIKEWRGAVEIERKLNYKAPNINDCCRGKQKTSYNFIWKYKN